VTPIRPNPYPVQPAANPAADAARQAAQKAFFAAAMGRTVAPAAPQAPALTPAPAPVQRAEIRPDPTAEVPAKVLRPGSLLDIRV
jgi:hypothetical protein